MENINLNKYKKYKKYKYLYKSYKKTLIKGGDLNNLHNIVTILKAKNKFKSLTKPLEQKTENDVLTQFFNYSENLIRGSFSVWTINYLNDIRIFKILGDNIDIDSKKTAIKKIICDLFNKEDNISRIITTKNLRAVAQNTKSLIDISKQILGKIQGITNIPIPIEIIEFMKTLWLISMLIIIETYPYSINKYFKIPKSNDLRNALLRDPYYDSKQIAHIININKTSYDTIKHGESKRNPLNILEFNKEIIKSYYENYKQFNRLCISIWIYIYYKKHNITEIDGLVLPSNDINSIHYILSNKTFLTRLTKYIIGQKLKDLSTHLFKNIANTGIVGAAFVSIGGLPLIGMAVTSFAIKHTVKNLKKMYESNTEDDELLLCYILDKNFIKNKVVDMLNINEDTNKIEFSTF